MKARLPHYWLRSLSALSINISAAWFAGAVIGSSITHPKNVFEFLTLTGYIAYGIVFLLISVLLKKELEK